METIYLIRHAMPQQPYSGRYDLVPGPSLSSLGRQQAQQTAQFLADKEVGHLFHSPLMRAAETAAIVADHLQKPSLQAEELAEWQRGEPLEGMRERAARFLETVMNGRNDQSGGAIALVSHGGVIECLLRHLSQDQVDLSQHNYWGRTTTPPAGVWQARRAPENDSWELSLVFDPDSVEAV